MAAAVQGSNSPQASVWRMEMSIRRFLLVCQTSPGLSARPINERIITMAWMLLSMAGFLEIGFAFG